MESETSKTYVFGNEGNNTVPAWLAYGNNGGWGNGFGGGWGTGILGFLLGALIGNNGLFGNGFGFGGNYGGAGFLSNQLNNDSGRELLMNAINSNGEAGRAATQNLATMLGQDFNTVNGAIQTIQGTLNSMALQNATTPLQIINSIQSGNSQLASQLASCCCENRLAICNQTNALQTSIAGVNENISATRAAQQLSDCQQVYALTETMNRNYQLLDNKIDALESSRKDREITALTAQVAKLESQNFTAGIVQQAVAPLNAAINGIAREVDDIKCSMPQTVPVQWPQIQAVNMTPYAGNYYGGGFYGNGWNNGINF